MLKGNYTKMRFLKFCSSASLALALLFSISLQTHATVSLNTYDLVDSGKHLDWSGSTEYSTAFADGVWAWEDHKYGVIRKDTWATIEDVVISDYYEDSGVGGVTSSKGTIKFNTKVMDDCIPEERQNVATHELGHALGLDHNKFADVMYYKITTQVDLSSNDQESYDAAYNKY